MPGRGVCDNPWPQTVSMTPHSAGSLSRTSGHGPAAAPVRHVHLGLGGFFRAHQATYTERASNAEAWGIAAFTGRSTELADQMSEQQGLYTLITQAPEGSRYDVVSSVSRAHPGTDQDSWLASFAAGATGVVTLTVTEGADLRRDDGGLDVDHPQVRADVEAIMGGPAAPVGSVPGRLVAGLAARRAADAGALAVVPCDNLSGNGAAVRRVVLDLADRVDGALAGWIADEVSFVTSMVDRITPRTSEDDRRAVEQATGLLDHCPVVTEPFTEWVLHGAFPAGRPAWHEAGASFVDDVTPFEQRKLWLLNGAHSLPAYAAGLRRPHPRPGDRGRRHVGPGMQVVDTTVVGRGRAAPAVRRCGDLGLPGCVAGALHEPGHPPPAGPDRRRRVAEAPGSHRAGAVGGAPAGTTTAGRDPDAGRVDAASARRRGAGERHGGGGGGAAGSRAAPRRGTPRARPSRRGAGGGRRCRGCRHGAGARARRALTR